ncbi:MAG: hypothetical protein ACD_75C01727G0001, partial [uncultured bacterium]
EADKPAAADGITREGIAGMSDEEVRKALLARVEESSSAKAADQEAGPGAGLDRLLQVLGQESDNTQKELRKLIGNIPGSISDLRKAFISLSVDGTSGGLLKNILWVFFFIGMGLLVEKVVSLSLRKRYPLFSTGKLNNLPASGEDLQVSEKLIAALATKLSSILGLLVFFVTAYFGYFAFVWTDTPSLRLLFLAVLLTITVVRVIAILAGVVLSPADGRFRIMPVGDTAAGAFYRVAVCAWGYVVGVTMFTVVVNRLGARPETIILIKACAASLLLAATAAAVLLFRKRVTAYILAQAPEEGSPSWGRQSLAPIWHFFALLYLVILWCLMVMSMVDPHARTKGAFLLSFFILPTWMLADKLLQWLVKHTMISLRLYEEAPVARPTGGPDAMTEEHRGRELFLKVNHYARLALIVGVMLWVANLWGYSIPLISRLSKVLFDSLVILAVALLFWQFISSWIERKIKESLPEGTGKRDDVDDEWGDATAQGRSYTLLPIIRSFVASMLIIMVVLTILSSMGVDIGPLLAGAGVIGLAVGFGAQKLVSDIFSGVFYLLDDAFRVGEYLTAGGIMGTVEKISLRNVMLRHHRGMLQIVPYSQLGTITNYMRGGIIEKFSLDFAYDADIDKIRKIVKKVGQEMLEDPELGKSFIRPLRSQGVREITNSVMTIRVKFTAQPGTQFTIRREAFKRITAALQARGIQYAHKKVIVDLPIPLTGHEDPAQMQKIALAAGAAAREIIDEEEKLKQLAQQKSGA